MSKYLLAVTLVTVSIIGLASVYLNRPQLTMIQRINSNPNVSWKAGENARFKGMTKDQIKSLAGGLQTPPSQRLPIKQITPLENIPEHFDAREQWPDCESIKEIRDQSTCGSCWAFAAVEAMSDRICIASGQKQQVRISSQDLLTCCGRTCGHGCGGGYPHAAWTYYKNHGLSTGWLYNTTEWCKPYFFPPCDHHTTGKYEPCGESKPTPKCVRECIDGYPKEYKEDLHYAKQVYGISKKVADIQTEIMTNGPVQVQFKQYEDFCLYKSGVYHHVEGELHGGHDVKIIGWGVENGVDYWLIANSWNEDWGEKGFVKFKRGTNECGIQSQVVAGIPKMP